MSRNWSQGLVRAAHWTWQKLESNNLSKIALRLAVGLTNGCPPDSLERQIAPAPNRIFGDVSSEQLVLPHGRRLTRGLTQGNSATLPQRVFCETNAATADMMSLPVSYYSTLVVLWFKEDHHWIPILDQVRLQQSLAALPDPVENIPDVVLRAVVALKIAYSSQAISLGYHGRWRLSLHLRSQVLIEAMAKPTLSSIQALCLIALLDMGSDEIPSMFNIMAMCRRTGEHIGLFRQLMQRIEVQSPAQVGLPSQESFTSDNHEIAITWAIIAVESASSLGVSWRDASAALEDHLSGIAYLSVPDFRDSFKTHLHLCTIGLNPVHEFFHAYAKGEHQDLRDQTLAVTENLYQNLISYARGLPTSHYTILANGTIDYDANYVFTRHLSNAAVIMIYQRYVFDETHDYELARERCLASYDQVIDVVRNISDIDTEFSSPLFVNFVAVAARFKLVLEHVLRQARGPLFDVLMHSINMCARRWSLARRIEIVLKAAIIEVDTDTRSGLPAEFWDLKQSGLDISEALKRWVTEDKPPRSVGLNGLYA